MVEEERIVSIENGNSNKKMGEKNSENVLKSTSCIPEQKEQIGTKQFLEVSGK